MRVNLQLDDELHRQAKAAAAEQALSLSRFVEEAIRGLLGAPVARLRLPVSTATGGLARGFSSLREAFDAVDLAADLRQMR
jgi:hypothetical protein